MSELLNGKSVLRFIARFIGIVFICGATLTILAWLVIVLPGMNSLLVRTLYVATVVLFFILLRNHRNFLALTLVVLALLPPVISLLIGMQSYIGLDSASYAEEDWKAKSPLKGSRPFVVHLSDPHFIGKMDGVTYEGNEWNVDTLFKTVERIIKLKPRFVIISGDVTDRGLAREWEQAEKILLSPLRKAGIELILAPGNHDLQPFFDEAPKAPGESWKGRPMSAYLKMAVRYTTGLETYDRIPFARRMVWIPPSEEKKKEIRDKWFQCASGCPMEGIRGCQSQCNQWLDRQVLSFEKYVEVEDACGSWYPMVRFEQESASLFVVLCSNRRLVETAGTNAIGELGDKQIEGLRKVLNLFPKGVQHVFVVMHHPVVKRPGERLGLPTEWSRRGIFASSAFEFAMLPNRLPESLEVVRIVQAKAALHPKIRMHIAFGHRHAAFLGKVKLAEDKPGIWISEAPAAYDPNGGIWIGYNSSHDIRIKWRRWSVN